MTTDTLVLEQRWDITFRHAAGETASHFFERLRDSKHLVGRRCPRCRRVLMPPRGFCDRCHTATDEWVDAEPQGVIEASTIVYHSFKGMPEPPYALAYVRLVNADTAMFNFLRGTDLSEPRAAADRIKIGTAVKVVFVDRPEGRMTDFWYELA